MLRTGSTKEHRRPKVVASSLTAGAANQGVAGRSQASFYVYTGRYTQTMADSNSVLTLVLCMQKDVPDLISTSFSNLKLLNSLKHTPQTANSYQHDYLSTNLLASYLQQRIPKLIERVRDLCTVTGNSSKKDIESVNDIDDIIADVYLKYLEENALFTYLDKDKYKNDESMSIVYAIVSELNDIVSEFRKKNNIVLGDRGYDTMIGYAMIEANEPDALLGRLIKHKAGADAIIPNVHQSTSRSTANPTTPVRQQSYTYTTTNVAANALKAPWEYYESSSGYEVYR